MVDVRSKISALHVQWVRRYVISPSSWSVLFSYCFLDPFGASPLTVLSTPSIFSSRHLPSFYAALLDAWCSCGGHFSPSSLGVGSGIAAFLLVSGVPVEHLRLLLVTRWLLPCSFLCLLSLASFVV